MHSTRSHKRSVTISTILESRYVTLSFSYLSPIKRTAIDKRLGISQLVWTVGRVWTYDANAYYIAIAVSCTCKYLIIAHKHLTQSYTCNLFQSFANFRHISQSCAISRYILQYYAIFRNLSQSFAIPRTIHSATFETFRFCPPIQLHLSRNTCRPGERFAGHRNIPARGQAPWDVFWGAWGRACPHTCSLGRTRHGSNRRPDHSTDKWRTRFRLFESRRLSHQPFHRKIG